MAASGRNVASDASTLFPDASPIRLQETAGADMSALELLNAAEHSHGGSPSRRGGPRQGSLNLGALIAKVTVLQRQAQEIEQDKVRLKEQREFADAERRRVKEMVVAAEAELSEVSERVKQLAKARDEHVNVAPESQYKELERRTRDVRALRMRVTRKEEHLEAVLGATRGIAEHVQRLRRSDVNTLSAANELNATPIRGAGDDDADASGEGQRSAYVSMLLQRTGEQAVALDRLRRAADNRDRLEDEAADNEARIRELRAALEDAGAPIPEAPQMHRTKRLISRASQHANAMVAGGSASHVDPFGTSAATRPPDALGSAQFVGLNTSAGVEPTAQHWSGADGASMLASTSAVSASFDPMSTQPRASSRKVVIPVGTLRAVAQRMGHVTIRDAAKAKGVTSLAVHVTNGTTELHCSGPVAGLDAFQSGVLAALDTEVAAQELDGLLTGNDPNVQLAVDDFADRLAMTLPVDPPKAVDDDTIRRQVTFGDADVADVATASTATDDSST